MLPDILFEHLPLPACAFDVEGVVVGENRAHREYMQSRDPSYGADTLIGRHIADLSFPKTKTELLAFIEEMFATDGLVQVEYEIPGSKGGQFGLLSAQRIVEDGVVIGGILVRQDVTDVVSTRQALSRFEVLFQGLGEELSEAVLFVDEHGKIIACNAGAADLLGVDQHELIGRPVADFSADPEGAPGRLRTYVDQGGGPRGVVEGRRADGEGFWVDTCTAILGSGDERIVCLIARDVTQRLENEREREKLQRLESLGVLAGGIAHDFNNLLAGIGGRLSLASTYAGRVGELPRLLAEAEQGVEQASRLTAQLLTFAKGGDPVTERVDLATLVKTESQFASTGSTTRFRYDIEDDLPDVLVDPGQIRQVVQNLVINARQAMGGKGSIEVVLRNIDVEAGDSSNLPPGPYVELRVTDEGPGIPAEVLDRVFEPYFSTKDSSGLGLATVHSIMARHAGSVTVDSPPGSGASFTIRLPVSDEKTVVPDDEAGGGVPLDGTDQVSMRVLVMDDNLPLLGLLGEMLHALGHEAGTAEHGEQALQLYRAALEAEQPYDAAILDLTIEGGMDGLETGRALLEMAPHLPVFLMSGYSESGISDNPQALGFAGFMSKPFTLNDVRDALSVLTSAV